MIRKRKTQSPEGNIKTSNIVAMALSNRLFRQRIVKSKKVYSRKVKTKLLQE